MVIFLACFGLVCDARRMQIGKYLPSVAFYVECIPKPVSGMYHKFQQLMTTAVEICYLQQLTLCCVCVQGKTVEKGCVGRMKTINELPATK